MLPVLGQRPLARFFAYLHGGTGGKLVQQVIDPFQPRELRPKPESFRIYKPKKLLEFDSDGVLLLYSYKHRWIRTMTDVAKGLLPSIVSVSLLISDPWPCKRCTEVNLEPLCLPGFLAASIYYLVKTIRIMSRYTLTAHEIRLTSEGTFIEVSFLNSCGQVWNHNRFTMHIADLAPPQLYSDSVPLRGDHFPVIASGFEIESDNSEPWVKFSDVVRKRIFLPKNYDYLDRELMVAVMSGQYIDTSNS